MFFKKKKVNSVSTGITLEKWLVDHRKECEKTDIEIYVGKDDVFERVATAYGIDNLYFGKVLDFGSSTVQRAITRTKDGRVMSIMVFAERT